MRFLCVSCNTQLKLIKNEKAVTPDSKGTLSIRWVCPDCLYEMAMFTNSFETQLVSSMGVEIGGKTVAKESLLTAPSTAPKAAGKCPFSQTARDAMMESVGMDTARSPETIDKGQSQNHLETEADKIKRAMGYNSEEASIQWTAQALDRLQNIPSFIRPVAKKGIEKLAMDRGAVSVTESFLDEAKEHFNM